MNPALVGLHPILPRWCVQVDNRDADIVMAQGEEGDARRAEIESHNGTVEPGLKMQLRKMTAHLVK